ncbi:Uncharacterised protein [uncultured archaeon]|nr:Uncharacterised protein [uncultured archaeon]
MAKKHIFSAHNDFKTEFFYKFFLIIGGILLIIYLIEIILHPIGLNDATIGTILAFVILCLGLGLMLYFFSRQFTKLSQIADEVEQNESLDDEEETKE